jgi:hypothetical protein
MMHSMDNSPDERRLNRRQFLRVVGFSTGGAALAPFLSASKPLGELRRNRLSRVYHAEPGGRLLGSTDGSTWNELVNFGPHLTVSSVKQDRDGWVLVTLVTGGSSFVLKSRDEKTWYTLDFKVSDES